MDQETDELRAAYLETNYVAEHDGEGIVIRIGESNNVLDKVLEAAGQTEWTFITAFNPFSKQLTDEENILRQDELRRELSRLGYSFWEGFGEAPDGEWPSEPSLLVFGPDREAASALAKKFEQNAIVCGRVGEAAELVWTGEED